MIVDTPPERYFGLLTIRHRFYNKIDEEDQKRSGGEESGVILNATALSSMSLI